jgi:hypothetical protein
MAQAGRAHTTCPAARLAREAAEVIIARSRADLVDNDLHHTLSERLEAIEDACTFQRARSELGAFFQVLLISGDMDAQMNWFAPGSDRQVRRLSRLCASVAARLETHVDQAAALTLRSYYFNKRFDRADFFSAPVRPRLTLV